MVGWKRFLYCGKTPQSTLIHCPVIALFSGDDKNTAIEPTSPPLGNSPVAELVVLNLRRKPSGSPLAGECGAESASTNPVVLTKTGQIALTRMPTGPSSFANDCVRPFMPNFVAQYIALFALPFTSNA